jgi:4-azaleucine resistance transporter AzlC
MEKVQHTEEQDRWREGVKRALPIVLGYIPIGFAYGVLADKSGLSPWNAIIMSVIVFAGSAQFIAVGLFAGGAGSLTVILTTFIVNLRHLLMSAALAPFMSKWKKRDLCLFSFELTDESFALHSTKTAELNKRRNEALALNVTAQISWVAGSVIGVVASGLILDIRPLGIDYALSAMFIGLLVSQCRDISRVLTAVIAGITATLLYLSGMNQFYVIVATVFAATCGMGVQQWIKK